MLGKTEKEWQAEEDARVLSRAEEVKSSPDRKLAAYNSLMTDAAQKIAQAKKIGAGMKTHTTKTKPKAMI